jgi:parallel beta-helix repeat protein
MWTRGGDHDQYHDLLYRALADESNARLWDLRRIWERLPYTLVTDYGAKGDGTSDDTAAVQAAATAAEGGCLMFPEGTYIIDPTSPILIPNSTRVTGCGATLKMKDSIATTSANYRLFYCATSGAENIEVDHLSFDGNRDGGNHGAGERVIGIWFTDCSNVHIHDCLFDNFRSEGVYFGRLSTASEYISVKDCHFSDCGFFEAGDTNTAARQGLAVISCEHGVFTGNTFDTICQLGIDLETNAATDYFRYCVISNNTFHDCGGLVGCSCDADGLGYGNVISGNVGTGTYKYGISMGYCDNSTIVGNIVDNASYSGISVTYCDYVSITGNRAAHTSSASTFGDITVWNSTYCVVVGNIGAGTVERCNFIEKGTSNYNRFGPNVCAYSTPYLLVGANSAIFDYQEVAAKTGDYYILTHDNIIIANKATAISIYLPASTGNGRLLTIKNINTGVATVDAAGTDTIDGAGALDLNQWESITVCDYATGTWAVI